MAGGERPGGSRAGGGISGGAGGRGLFPASAAPPGNDPRAARRRWASGVAVVTTREGTGYRGAVVSAVSFVSLEPPLLLVCLDRAGRMATLLPEVGRFAISILGRDQEFLAERFAGRAPLPDARLTGVPFHLGAAGCPLLDGALAALECDVTATHAGGDHVIVVAAVTATEMAPDTDDPLLTYEGRYRGLEGA